MLEAELGQQTREATGEQGLAASGGADQENVVCAGGGDFECPPGVLLTPNLRQIELGLRILQPVLPVGLALGQRLVVAQKPHHGSEVTRGSHTDLGADAGLLQIRDGRHDLRQTGGATRHDQRQRSAHRMHPPVQPELPYEERTGQLLTRQRNTGGCDAEGDRQVER